MCTCVVNHLFVCMCIYRAYLCVGGICVFISVWYMYIMYVSVHVGVRACVCIIYVYVGMYVCKCESL